MPICAHAAPAAITWTISPPKTTESTAAAVGSIVITTRASRTASAGDAASSTPASESGAATDGDRSHAVVISPARARLRAIAEPMMPVPSTATRTSPAWLSAATIRASFLVTRPAYGL